MGGPAPPTVLSLTPLEVATGFVTGPSEAEPLPALTAAVSPRAALERGILPALERTPCLVSFSGGRDSSALLALATDLARRHGLPAPGAVTARFPAQPRSEESAWQERVVGHVGVKDWECREFADELDLVGPVAGPLLRRHGLLYPAQAHFHAPLFVAARGGTLITGFGGDEVLGLGRFRRAVDVVTGRARPRPRDALNVVHMLAPEPARRRWRRRTARRVPLPWLLPAAREELLALAAREDAEPARWAARLRWLARRRWVAAVTASLGALAHDVGARVVHPFVDRGFLAALAAERPLVGPGDRDAVMRALFADLLPDDVLTRADKTGFRDAYWGPHSREFAASWSGGGVDREVVDEDVLRRLWATGRPLLPTALLLQSAWLAGQRG